MKKIIVIVGPTGSGKTGLSIKLAKILRTEIINGDSVQIYKGLDIGSAKISDEEKQGIKHHLLDIKEPGEPYSVYNFQQDVRALFDKIELPMIVGGTGLYIKAALYNYEFIASSKNQDFEETYQEMTNEEIHHKLLELDPFVTVDVGNRRRLLRALELALDGDFRSLKTKKDELLYDALIIYLDLDRSILEERLRVRLDDQLKKGFIEEVQGLKDKNIQVNAIGYRELKQYLDGIKTLDEAKEEIIHVSRKLAKKQKTWFKNQMHPIMMDALSPTLFEDTLKIIQIFLKEKP
ncbi:MAG: tRNA (adenosine(37)-N6)-dimethylallyltransferase MiaA [Tenericutes bacterium GWC2_39_45]|nr:MAG: tRNA (adenosine(37)-N6)-dimethylallyltransferase MiaA [Tenericutes bacterium GWC2_39_45]OHE32780.1 MAG: tRNA (adenosine(37)-N6)-dimethylallyltransferase MiaA [Tenericutes bacterium GWD2_38_27]OHE40934.1 MAG: tRNA (adenosine(37)-N6)-dimethylallyltransferase MiaA [Tenericutes bacterium GWF2_38_8]HBG32746.1 tRNA (adenosine(37)-N6)-dimethylallyltransferase MiaA [Acholeplasmataceae bacterium]HCB66360.1 tRNA (adenosine(37)-N6)-dimethylallyltransferase MiaA [Acholeplasmataceae bacterium]